MRGLPDFRKLWNFQEPGQSEQRLRDVLPAAEASGDRNYLLELKTQIGRALGLQSKFEQAHAVLDEVESELDDSTQVARLRYLLERGRALRSSGFPDEARPLFEQAWELGRAIPRPSLAVDAAHMVALVVPSEEKRAWNEAAMHYAEESGDTAAQQWLGTLYNNMGWDSHDAKDYEEALSLHRKCWEWHKERGTGGGERIAKWSVAKQLRFLGQREEALCMQQELLQEYAREEPDGDGFVHEEIAELKYAAGDAPGGRPHFARAFELLREYEWIDRARLDRLRKLGGME